jgi:glycosyltransferase involved in cell wall biosynthesis
MTVAAVTITYNRLDLTKKTVESFYEKTNVDYHLFIDNGSTDGTDDWLWNYNHIRFVDNRGIAYAFREACEHLRDYDFILKLDNDIETVTPDIIAKMLKFYELNGNRYVCSPVDLNIDPSYYPKILHREYKNGYNVEFTTHTGGAFQLIPQTICRMLCKEFRHLKAGDEMIGRYFRTHTYRPCYLKDLEMRHIGLNQTSPNYIL